MRKQIKSNIDPDRIIKIAESGEKPKNEIERLFIRTYEMAIVGELLFDALESVGAKLNQLTYDEYDAIIIGYAYGQARLESFGVKDENQTTH